MPANSKVTAYISDSITEAEWLQLKNFSDLVDELEATALFQSGMPGGKGNFDYDKASGFRFTVEGLPPEEQIAQFVLAFRHFFADKEPSHFPKILNIIGRNAEGDDANPALRQARRRWEDFLFKGAVHFTINDKRITSKYVLNLWFNAQYFHRDEDKREELKQLNAIITVPYSKEKLRRRLTNN